MGFSNKQVVDLFNNTLNLSSLSAIELAKVTSVAKLTNESYSISLFSDLPNPALNTGRMIFVDTLNKYFYSNGIEWTDNIEAPNLTLWTWGRNNYGQIGDNSVASRSSPGTTSGGGTNWSMVSGGGFCTAAIKTDGTLWTWGRNTTGDLGDGTTTARSSPVTTAGGGTNWNIVSSGYEHTAAIKTDGTLWTWGNNNNGQLGSGSSGAGTSRSSPFTISGGGTNWSMVGSGSYHTAAIKSDGTLWGWGYNLYGQLGDNSVTERTNPVQPVGSGTNWSMVSGGTQHTIAIKTDGTLWTWGRNYYSTLGDNSLTDRSSPGTTAGGGTNWYMVSCGAYHSAAIKTDGTLWTWGRNNNGQLGNNFSGVGFEVYSPVTTAGGGTNWSIVSGGFYHSAAIKTDGTLWSWGYNFYGNLADGSIANKSSPVTTAGGGTTWSMVECGFHHTVAIK